MALFGKDHYEMMEQFEKLFKGEGRMDREDKSLWSKGFVYQHGEINRLFKAYRAGAAYGQAVSA